MDGGAPVYFFLTYVDGVAVPVPAPDYDTPRGFSLGGPELRAARQWDHYARVRCHARRLPDLAAGVGGEDALVDLMYGDVDDFGRLLQGCIAPGVYLVYEPIC